MPDVILICGKICSGKPIYAEEIRRKYNAVILSCDELTLSLKGEFLPEKHDDICKKFKRYLLDKSCDILNCGVSVILEFGFWTRHERTSVKNFFAERGVAAQLHYIKVSDEIWEKHIQCRNELVKNHMSNNYFVDEGLKKKSSDLFEEPCGDEIDRLIEIYK